MKEKVSFQHLTHIPIEKIHGFIDNYKDSSMYTCINTYSRTGFYLYLIVSKECLIMITIILLIDIICFFFTGKLVFLHHSSLLLVNSVHNRSYVYCSSVCHRYIISFITATLFLFVLYPLSCRKIKVKDN